MQSGNHVGSRLPEVAGGGEPRQAELEDLGEVGDVGVRNAISISRECHRLQQSDGGLPCHVLLGRAAEAAGVGYADRCIDIGGIRSVEIRQHRLRRVAQGDVLLCWAAAANGADSRRMPRLVLQPAAASAACVAAQDALADLERARGDAGAEASAAASNCAVSMP